MRASKRGPWWIAACLIFLAGCCVSTAQRAHAEAWLYSPDVPEAARQLHRGGTTRGRARLLHNRAGHYGRNKGCAPCAVITEWRAALLARGGREFA